MKNKIISILYVFLISCLFINCNVYAVEITPSPLPEEIQFALKNNEYYNDSSYDYLVYNYDSNYCICFIKKTDTLKWHVANKGSGYWFLANEIFASHEYIYNSSYVLKSTTYSENRDWLTTYKGGFVNPSLIFTSSFDIYTDNTYSEIFFLKAPPEEIPEVETPKATTLQEIMEQVEKEAILKEIVVLLPVILSVLVSLIALRKALKMLLGSLRTS